jgi:hypothetical protein
VLGKTKRIMTCAKTLPPLDNPDPGPLEHLVEAFAEETLLASVGSRTRGRARLPTSARLLCRVRRPRESYTGVVKSERTQPHTPAWGPDVTLM